MTTGKPTAEATLQALRQVMAELTAGKPVTLSSAVNDVPEALALIGWVNDLQEFAMALGKGDLVAKASGKGPVIGSLKTLQASLRHLTFQTKLVAGGDFTQRVDFMGEFSQAFNAMASQLQQAYADLQERNRELEALNRIQQRITSIVAHDLRTPLNGVLGGLKYILEETDIQNLDEEQREFMTLIQQSAESQLALINRLLNLSSLQRSARSVTFEPIPLKPLIQEAAAAVRPMCEVKGLWLRLDVQEGLTPVGDAIRIGQVIANLLNNALKFTEQGGVTITARQRGSEVLVIVEDTGKGIPEKTIPKLFLGDLTTTGTAGEEGTGIGLPLCRDIVAAHEGRLWAESNEGKGSTFFVALHACLPEKCATARAAKDALK